MEVKRLGAALTDACRRIRELEDSAASAREIARVVMTDTGTRGIRVELATTADGIRLIVCDPAGDEMVTAKRIAGLIDKATRVLLGVEPTGEAVSVGSTA